MSVLATQSIWTLKQVRLKHQRTCRPTAQAADQWQIRAPRWPRWQISPRPSTFTTRSIKIATSRMERRQKVSRLEMWLMAIQVLRTMSKSLPMRYLEALIKLHPSFNLKTPSPQPLRPRRCQTYSLSNWCNQWVRGALGGERRQLKQLPSSRLRKRLAVWCVKCRQALCWFNQMGPHSTKRRVTPHLRKNSEALSCVLVRSPPLLTRPLTSYLCPKVLNLWTISKQRLLSL